MKVVQPQRIRSARQRKGYTQSDLAALVGCTQQYISLLESGMDNDCSEKVALSICKRLDLDLDVIFEHHELHGNASSKPASKRRRAAA